MSNILTILTDEDPLLREVSAPVADFDETLEQFAHDMITTMMDKNGLGLAAVQVGKLQRIIIAREVTGTTSSTIYVMVNPVFLRKGNRLVTEREGCLSIPPHKWRPVSRPAKCEVEYYDLQGNKHSLNMSGMLARIVQHECDHLDGILITDKPPAILH